MDPVSPDPQFYLVIINYLKLKVQKDKCITGLMRNDIFHKFDLNKINK